MQDVEDIVDSWENTGLLHDCPDRFNTALMLDTQRKVNERHEGSPAFKRISLPVVLLLARQDTFQGLIDTADCCDVYKLGRMSFPWDHDLEREHELVKELSHRVESLGLPSVYFAGMVAKDGQVYLLVG